MALLWAPTTGLATLCESPRRIEPQYIVTFLSRFSPTLRDNVRRARSRMCTPPFGHGISCIGCHGLSTRSSSEKSSTLRGLSHHRQKTNALRTRLSRSNACCQPWTEVFRWTLQCTHARASSSGAWLARASSRSRHSPPIERVWSRPVMLAIAGIDSAIRSHLFTCHLPRLLVLRAKISAVLIRVDLQTRSLPWSFSCGIISPAPTNIYLLTLRRQEIIDVSRARFSWPASVAPP